MNPDAMAKRMMQRANNQDGLPEIAAGLTLLAAAGLIYVQTILPSGSPGVKTASIAFTVVIPVLCLSAAPLLKWIRERYLIERVGYVQHRPVPKKQVVLSALIGLAMMPVLFWIQPLDGVLLAATGIAGGLLLALCGRAPRFLIGGVLMAAAGVLTGAAGLTLNQGFAALFGFMGLLTLLSGSVVLARFVRRPA